jgi:hypothetical protein
MTRSPNGASPARGQSSRLDEPSPSPPVPWRGDREALAKIIDPEAFKLRKFVDKRHPHVFNPGQLGKQIVALAKADAILALRLEGWRPIETAPRDGTAIWSWDGADQAAISWCSCCRHWCLSAERDREWTGVTHWQPLPPPPLSAKDSGEGLGSARAQPSPTPKSADTEAAPSAQGEG